MKEISTAIESIREAAAHEKGLLELSKEAGVPYTTVRSFADRNWSHKNLVVFEKLAEAAKRINRRRRVPPQV